MHTIGNLKIFEIKIIEELINYKERNLGYTRSYLLSLFLSMKKSVESFAESV